MALVFWDANIIYGIIGGFEGKSQRYGHKWKRIKVPFHQNNAQCHKSLVAMADMHELGVKLLLHPLYSLDFAPATIGCLHDLKECSKARDLDQMMK